MAYAVSQNFTTAVKDITARKSCLVLFSDLFFSTSDFTDSGVTFSQFFNTSDDLTWGDTPSDTISFGVVANGALSGYGFGKAQAYLGVQTGITSDIVTSACNAFITVNSRGYMAKSDGLYRSGTKIDNGVYKSLISDGTTVWAVGESSAVSVTDATGTVSAYTPNRFMAQKLQSGLSAVFNASDGSGSIWEAVNADGTSWVEHQMEYVPFGQYNVVKPRSTAGDTVVIQDAYDNMSLFDRDATAFIDSLTFPITLSGIYTALCDFVGVSYASSTFTYSTESYASSPFSENSCTCRDILWWIAEKARRVAHCDRIGRMDLMEFGSSAVESLRASDIGMDGYSIAEYKTPNVTGVLLRSDSGSTLSFGDTTTCAYVISSNPFVGTITNSDLQAYWAIPTYVPMECTVLEADPSVDLGDMIDVRPAVNDIEVLTNVYKEVYATLYTLQNQNGKAVSDPDGTLLAYSAAYAIETPTYKIPLMQRTLRFINGMRAEYVATGNEQREADISNTEYNASVAYSRMDAELTQQSIFDRLTNNGETQGIYLADGKIYVNAEYIKTGTLSADYIVGGFLASPNGNYSVNMETGSATLKDVTITGGSIDIDSTSSTVDIIKLNYTDNSVERHARISPYSFKVNFDNGTSVAESSILPAAFTVWLNGTILGGLNNYAVYYNDSNGTTRSQMNATGFKYFDSAGTKRVQLDDTGLMFYNSSGTLIKTYSAT